MSAEPPPMSAVQPMTPPALDHVVKKCLAKDPDDRWQSAGDLASELRWVAEAGSQAGAAAPVVVRRMRREQLGWIVAAVLLLGLIAAVAVAVGHLREVREEPRAARFLVAAPEKSSFRWYDAPVVSPDGRQIAFTGGIPNGIDGIWVRTLDSLTAQLLPGTAGASFPFWSPDSRVIGFFAGGKLKKIDVSGGSPQTVCDAAAATGAGGTWNRDGVIVFAAGFATPLSSVSAAGGEPKAVTALDRSRRETSHRWPSFLPDGRHFLYVAAVDATASGTGRTTEPWEVLPLVPVRRPAVTVRIYVGSLDSSDPRSLLVTDSGARYASGSLLYVRGVTLMRQPFDLKELRSTGDPFPLAEQVAPPANQVPTFSVSDQGTLAYRSGVTFSRLVWVDRAGKELRTIGEPGDYSNPALSRDGRRVAVGRIDPQTRTRDIWLFDVKRGTSSRFTFDPADDLNPVWSSDGSRIAFTSDRRGQRDIYQKMAAGIGEDEPSLASDQSKNVNDWSSDGRFILYDTLGPRATLWVLPLFGERKPFPFVQTKFDTRSSQFSPDGRWVAYSSNESGRYEVTVQSFPGPGAKWQVSTAGGTEPQWRRDGRELFYVADTRMMAVDVKADSSTFEAGIPKTLFETRLSTGVPRNRYVVTADGQGFLINRPVEQTSSPITVVLNWPAALKE